MCDHQNNDTTDVEHQPNNENKASNCIFEFDTRMKIFLGVVLGIIIIFVILMISQGSSHSDEIAGLKDSVEKAEKGLSLAKADANKQIMKVIEQANEKYLEQALLMTKSIATVLNNEVRDRQLMDIDLYFTSIVQDGNVFQIMLLDKEGKVIATTNKKFNGQTLMDDLTKKVIASTTNNPISKKLEHEGEYEVVTPIYHRITGIVAVLRISFKLPKLELPKNQEKQQQ